MKLKKYRVPLLYSVICSLLLVFLAACDSGNPADQAPTPTLVPTATATAGPKVDCVRERALRPGVFRMKCSVKSGRDIVVGNCFGLEIDPPGQQPLKLETGPAILLHRNRSNATERVEIFFMSGRGTCRNDIATGKQGADVDGEVLAEAGILRYKNPGLKGCITVKQDAMEVYLRQCA
jgi:hypothetical protein